MIKQIYPEINRIPIEKPNIFEHSDAITETLKEVAKETGIPIYEIRGKSRRPEIVEARIMYAKRAAIKVNNVARVMRAINRDASTYYNY